MKDAAAMKPGASPALELVNTRIMRGGVRTDLVPDVAALRAWLAARRATLPWHGALRRADVAAFHALREALDALLRALVAQRVPAPGAVAALNQALAAGDVAAQLEWTRNGPRRRAVPAASARPACLGVLARDALALLTGPQATRLRACSHPSCCVLFIARSARQRWCSDRCGNRARVQRHHARRSTGGE